MAEERKTGLWEESERGLKKLVKREKEETWGEKKDQKGDKSETESGWHRSTREGGREGWERGETRLSQPGGECQLCLSNLWPQGHSNLLETSACCRRTDTHSGTCTSLQQGCKQWITADLLYLIKPEQRLEPLTRKCRTKYPATFVSSETFNKQLTP